MVYVRGSHCTAATVSTYQEPELTQFFWYLQGILISSPPLKRVIGFDQLLVDKRRENSSGEFSHMSPGSGGGGGTHHSGQCRKAPPD